MTLLIDIPAEGFNINANKTFQRNNFIDRDNLFSINFTKKKLTPKLIHFN